jgi:hypothetical protein
MSLTVGSYCQHEMSLKRPKWVDHQPHGDRHERLAIDHDRAGARLSGGDGGRETATLWLPEDRYVFIQRTLTLPLRQPLPRRQRRTTALSEADGGRKTGPIKLSLPLR